MKDALGPSPYSTLPMVGGEVYSELLVYETYVRQVTKFLIPIDAIAYHKLIGYGETEVVNCYWDFML